MYCDETSLPAKKSASRKKIITYDDNGEVLSEYTTNAPHAPKKKNGCGFVLSYTDKMIELLKQYPTGSTLRVFLYLAHKQNYAPPIYGYRCTRRHIMEALDINRTSLWECLRTLHENYLVLESVIDGQSEFMVNPAYVSVGNDRNARLKEWSRRWEAYFKSTGGKMRK